MYPSKGTPWLSAPLGFVEALSSAFNAGREAAGDCLFKQAVGRIGYVRLLSRGSIKGFQVLINNDYHWVCGMYSSMLMTAVLSPVPNFFFQGLGSGVRGCRVSGVPYPGKGVRFRV